MGNNTYLQVGDMKRFRAALKNNGFKRTSKRQVVPVPLGQFFGIDVFQNDIVPVDQVWLKESHGRVIRIFKI